MPLANTFPAPFAVNPGLTAITIAYRNENLIADDVLPRVPVDTPSFNYSIFGKGDSFTIPDTKVGRTSDVNQVDYSATQASATVDDQALDEVVPNRDKAIASAYTNSPDPESVATEQISDLLALAREVRAAGVVFNAANYATANKATLSGTGQWSDYTNSDPATAILQAMDTMLMRPNQLVIGRAVATVLQLHPKLVQAFHGNNGQFGKVPTSFLADYFEVDEVLVGEGWVNTAQKGQAPSLARVWGKNAALLYKAPVTADTHSMTFGITAQWGERISATYQDPKKGMRGSTIVRVGESVKELSLANDLGYFFQNAVA
jgi:hypothetical protein